MDQRNPLIYDLREVGIGTIPKLSCAKCLSKVKVKDFEVCTFIAFALKFCAEYLLSLGGGTGWMFT